MQIDLRRRDLFLLAAAGAAAPALTLRAAPVVAATPALPASFPLQDPELVREVVGASHFDLDRVRELVNRQPALAKAAIDWGFGDWESALGAAAHTGRREIAELLLSHGARPTIFSAAMMGQLAVVRAYVESSPGIQGTSGPHGIALLQHAVAGGEAAAPVREYLERVGGADAARNDGPPRGNAPYLGSYRVEGEPEVRIAVTEHRRGFLQLAVDDGTARGLAWVEGDAFHPAGAQHVRVEFRVESSMATELTVRDGDLTVMAARL